MASSPRSRRRLLTESALTVVGVTVFAACTERSQGSTAQAQSPGAARLRCAHCGMRVTRGAAFASGAREASGTEVFFDSPKCLFRFLAAHRDASAAWCTEYLTRSERPVGELFFLLGSDLRGPMGVDLVPVDTRAHADELLQRHHGTRVLVHSEITPAIVDALFQ